MPLISKPNYNQIFASQAPEQDKPAVFNNYPEGWGPESRPNNGKPTIKGFNYLQQTSDLKDLWVLQNGACLPYDESIEYAEGAPVLKDGVIQYKTSDGFKSRDSVTIPTYSKASDGVDPVTGVVDGAYFNVRSSSDESYVEEYQNIGGVPTPTGKTYPSGAALTEVKDAIIDPVTGEATTSKLKDKSGKWQDEINEAIFKNTYYAELEGFVTGGVTDNFAVWQTLKSKLNNGDSVIFKGGDFFFSQEISIDKVVSIQGMLRSQAIGTVFKFNGTSGVTRNSQYANLENIAISGTKTSTVLDFDNRIFGTVGLKEAYSSPTTRSSGGILRNVSVVGFDVNRLAAQENSEIWAGAYRENYNVLLRSGRYGYVALDGVTHDKFYGGVISANTEGGIHSKATKFLGGAATYNNIEIHGTTMEQNGNQNPDFVGDATDYDVNIYSYGNSRVKLYGAYNEHVSNFAVDGGEIIYFGTHQHSNVKNFASDGQIIDYSGYGAYANTLRFDYKLARLFTANTGATTASISVASNTMQVSSSTNSTVQIATPTINVRSIKNKELRAVKIAYQYKFNSGFTTNTDLVVQPIIRLLSATAARTDTNTINKAFPTQILKKSYGQAHSFEFYYIPRFSDTTYLDADGVLSAVQLILQLKNGSSDPNFSADSLSLEIDSVEITLISDVKFDLRYDLPKDGTTASRPTLSIFERGFMYYDTTLGRNVVWDGSAWQELYSATVVSNTASMSSATNAINTIGKAQGKTIYNATSGLLYFSIGSTPTSAWRAANGSGDITPV